MITFEAVLVSVVVVAAILWFFRSSRVALKKPEVGAVYLVKAGRNSWFHKIGMTARPFRERKQELLRTHNDGKPIHEVALIRNLPFAWDVEQYFHKRISKTRYHLKGRRDNPNTANRGKEFYVLKTASDVDFFLSTLERAVDDVRRVAKRRGRWPDDADERVNLVVWRGGKPSEPIFLYANRVDHQEAAE
ncbi:MULTISPECIES: GIY-YIG nuclease family protein [unclassified Pannonibacter]|uniref:GIY-YIG nuclease family protein n=1 Tax=unclassified Pannonibacter TaxID=2627228 RepID=UPI001648A712|nr:MULTISPECIES: GIY-YIG nuclease family protein [unclassified Pannonibacter]